MSNEGAAYRYLEKRRRKQRLFINTSLLIALGAMVSTVSLLFTLKDQPPGERIAQAFGIAPKEPQYAALETEFEQFRAETQASLKLISKAPSSGVQVAEVSRLAEQLKAMDVRMARLESALAVSPDRALALPLMRKELDGMSARLTEQRAVAVVEADRLYDVLLGVLALLAGLMTAVVGSAVAFLKGWGNGQETVPKSG